MEKHLSESREERLKRVVARGEVSGHSHIVIGDVTFTEKDGVLYCKVASTENGARLAHIMEKPFIEAGEIVWTEEHTDIKDFSKGKILKPNRTYEFVPQIEKHPYEDAIRRVAD